MFAGHRPVNIDGASVNIVSGGHVKTGLFPLSGVWVHAVPSFHTLFRYRKVSCDFFVERSVPVAQTVVTVVTRLADPALACVPAVTVQRLVAKCSVLAAVLAPGPVWAHATTQAKLQGCAEV